MGRKRKPRGLFVDSELKVEEAIDAGDIDGSFKWTQAQTLNKAVNSLNDEIPDFISIGTFVSDKDGYETLCALLTELVERKKYGKTTFIFHTTHKSLRERMKSYHKGFVTIVDSERKKKDEKAA